MAEHLSSDGIAFDWGRRWVRLYPGTATHPGAVRLTLSTLPTMVRGRLAYHRRAPLLDGAPVWPPRGGSSSALQDPALRPGLARKLRRHVAILEREITELEQICASPKW